jgi:hypothetical protein
MTPLEHWGLAQWNSRAAASDLLSKSDTSPDDQRERRAAKKLKNLRTVSQPLAKESLANVHMAAL